MKVLRRVLIIVVLVIVALLVARNVLIRSASRQAIRQATGFDIEIGKVKAGLFRPTFEVLNLKLINPEDFPEREALEIRRLYVRYDVASLLTDTVRLREVEIDVPRMVVVTREDGETNLKRLGKVKQKPPAEAPAEGSGAPPEAAEGAAPPEPRPARAQKNIVIDHLVVKLGTATVHSYVGGREKPETVEAPMNVERTFQNVSNLNVVAAALSADIMTAALPSAFSDINQILQKHEGDLDAAGKEIEKKFKELKAMFKK